MEIFIYYSNIIVCIIYEVILYYITCIMVINKHHTMSEELYSCEQ